MHIPDGFIDATTSLGAGAIAAGGVAVAARRAGDALDDDKAVPLAGLVATFVFAVQMLNFPVAAGTSGHLMGGALAAILVGPWVGVLVMTVVLMVQALFADGGLSALGLNILNLGLVAPLAGWALFRAGARVVRSSGGLTAAAGIAAGLSVLLTAGAFSLEYAIGGRGGADPGAVAAAMLGVHSLIAIGEGVITGLSLATVLRVRPDLISGVEVIRG